MNKGRYFKSAKQWEYATGRNKAEILNMPCIHVSGSVKGMRHDFWGYSCDVVRIGNYIYKAN